METVLVSSVMNELETSISQVDASATAVNAMEVEDITINSIESTAHQEQGSVVILRSDPLRLPMVCGLCGSQFATAREIEHHMNVHREGEGITIRRGRGRPKGSKTKKPLPAGESVSETAVDINEADPLSSTDDDAAAGTQSRRSQRPIKRPNTDVYVHDDKELDDLLEGDKESYSKDEVTVSELERGGVQIARLEDYVSRKVLLISKSDSTQVEGLTETELGEGGLFDLQDKPEAATVSAVIEQSTSDHAAHGHPGQETNSGEANGGMTQLMVVDELDMHPVQQVGDSANLLITDSVVGAGQINTNTGDEDVTHIEVCLEVFGNEFAEQTGVSESDVVGPEAKSKMCELCFTVLKADKMREHMIKVHMNLATQEFACPKPDCETLFSTIHKLRQHMTEQHQTPTISNNGRLTAPKLYSCEVTDCNSIHKTKNALKLHMSDVHGDLAQQSTTCEICQKVFKSKRAQSSHMKAHTKTLDPVKCAKCGKEFKHPSALKFHISMMPECDKPKYVCDICGYKAVTPWRLNSHKQQVHSNVRPYTCQYCQKTYKTNEMLRQHKYKLHTGTPTFECEQCHKKFFYAAELREHSQLHFTTKQFVCPICHRAFKTMHVFRGHMNGKHSDTWYSCGFCKFTTSHKKSMKRHMVLVHKLKNVTLEVTPEDNTSVIPQQVEIIQNDTELPSLQISETGQVINSMQHVQYEDVDQHTVVMQHPDCGEMVTHQQFTGEVIGDEHIVGQVITHEQMDEESLRQLINNHQQVGSMNVSEVSQVLVALSSSGVVVAETDAVNQGVISDTAIVVEPS